MQPYNENHQRVFTSLARVVSQKLVSMQQSLQLTPTDFPISVDWRVDLSTEEKDMIIDKIAQLREHLCTLSLHYLIEPKVMSQRRDISVKASFLWEELADSTGNRLANYGPIDEAVKMDYEVRIQELTHLVEAILSICS